MGKQQWFRDEIRDENKYQEYDGEWLDDKPHTENKEATYMYKYENGGKMNYKGHCKEGVRQGQGKLTYQKNGMEIEYVGEWEDNKPHGKGKEIMKKEGREYTYDGDFEDGLKEGEGKYTWPNGSYYTGKWHEDKFHGRGTYQMMKEDPENKGKWILGDKYEGRWDKGNFKKGDLILTTGAFYKDCQFKNGRPHGYGIYDWGEGNKGRQYKGEFRDGKFHGRAEYRGSNTFANMDAIEEDGTKYLFFKYGKKCYDQKAAYQEWKQEQDEKKQLLDDDTD